MLIKNAKGYTKACGTPTDTERAAEKKRIARRFEEKYGMPGTVFDAGSIWLVAVIKEGKGENDQRTDF